MTIEEAKEIFLNRGYIQVKGGRIYDGDKWRESVVVISKWLEQEPCEDCYGEAMDFPNTFDEFAEWYGFTDKEEHYTNGSQLIPVFRVKQWLNHIPNNSENMTVEQYRARMIEAFHNADCDCLIALVSLPTEKEFEHLEWLLKNYYKKQSNSYEDCISRAEAIKALEYDLSLEADGGFDKYRTVIKDLLNAIYNTQKKAIEDLPSIQPTAKENLVVGDCISRQAVLDMVEDVTDQYGYKHRVVTEGMISLLPPVTPKPKTGHWKFIQRGKFIDICCSECGYVSVKDYAYNYTIDQLDEQEKKDFFAEAHMNFCECCGAKMLPTDSEKE